MLSDGERFPHLMDRLIRATAARNGIAQSNMRTQIRTNITDGGIDTAVDFPIPGDSTGWFEVPTAWQYKAKRGVDIDDGTTVPAKGGGSKPRKTPNELKKEINKPKVVELIKRGYGFRFCVLGDLAPAKVADWESQLERYAYEIHASAAKPRVVQGGSLPSWIEMFPAVCEWLSPSSTRNVLHFESWESICLSSTKSYVESEDWINKTKGLKNHFDFAIMPRKACFQVFGLAGVGKTRLVFEVLRSMESSGIVVYAEDDAAAIAVAHELLNSSGHVILVADETSQSKMIQLEQLLKGAKHRIRVACITNVLPEYQNNDSQLWLTAPTNVDQVLEANFGHVPRDRRRRYSELSAGYIRLAVDMCEHDQEIISGSFDPYLGTVHNYVSQRLNQLGWLEISSIITLFPKVGFKDDVADELEALAAFSQIPSQNFREAVRKIKDSPGFLTQQGRYWYVTPDVVARVLFREGWTRWVEHDLDRFATALPSHMLKAFTDRAAALGERQVKSKLGEMFRIWSSSLTTNSLADDFDCDRLAMLVEMETDFYLPMLARMLDSASLDSIKQISGYSSGSVVAPRRRLVWLLETLVAFEEYFHDAEQCLYKLALAESEPEIGNNSTEIWSQLFAIQLSGTSLPATIRFEKLKERLRTEPNDLLIKGLGVALSGVNSKMLGPPTFGGRLVPDSWDPTSVDDFIDASKASLGLVQEFMKCDRFQARAFDLFLLALPSKIESGLVAEVIEVCNTLDLTQEQKRDLYLRLDEYIKLFGNPTSNASKELESIKSWRDDLSPQSELDRFFFEVSREPWDQNSQDAISDLAESIVKGDIILAEHLTWLNSEKAQSAESLLYRVGEKDRNGELGEIVIRDTVTRETSKLLRGYVRGTLARQGSFSESFISCFDRLQKAAPERSVEVLVFAGDALNSFERLVSLVRARLADGIALSNLGYHYGGKQLPPEKIGIGIGVLLERFEEFRDNSLSAAARFLAATLQRSEEKLELHGALEELAWKVVELPINDASSKDAYYFNLIIEALAEIDRPRAFGVWGNWLQGKGYTLNRKASENLASQAASYPEEVFNVLGSVMLSGSPYINYGLRELTDLVARLPEDIIRDWILKHGQAAAKAIARHLPKPYLDEAKHVVVPKLFDFVLGHYRTDEVLQSAALSGYSGVWWGNGAERFRNKARVAELLFQHENEQIRKWAKSEYEFATRMADREELEHEERFLPGN